MEGPAERLRLGRWAHTLYVSVFYSFGWLHAPRVLVLRRSADRYPNLAAVEVETARVIAKFPEQRVERLLVDMRAAPPTNDPGFERAMQGLRQAVALRVQHVVLLVATASGEMQVTRLQRAEMTAFQITRDVDEALRLAAET